MRNTHTFSLCAFGRPCLHFYQIAFLNAYRRFWSSACPASQFSRRLSSKDAGDNT